MHNSPTLINGYIYIGTSRGGNYELSSDNAFFKLDAGLNKVWRYELGTKEVMGSATLDSEGNIYFIVGEGRSTTEYFDSMKLYSLSNNGQFRWSKLVYTYYSPVPFKWMGISSPAVSVDDVIYAGGDKFFAFDKAGNELWSYGVNTGNPILNAPIIDPAGNIYIRTLQDLVSLDKNGNLRWIADQALWAGGMSNQAFSVDYSKVYVTSLTLKSLLCINSSNGTLAWRYNINDMSGDFRNTPAVDDQNNIYFGTHGEYNGDSRQMLYAVKSDGSGLLWQNNLGSDLYSSPALGNDRKLYIGSEGHGKTGNNNNRLHAIDMASGNVAWSAQLETDITWSSPAIANNGTLYIATMETEGKSSGVFSFRTDCTGLLPNAGSARFHEGNASTGRRE